MTSIPTRDRTDTPPLAGRTAVVRAALATARGELAGSTAMLLRILFAVLVGFTALLTLVEVGRGAMGPGGDAGVAVLGLVGLLGWTAWAGRRTRPSWLVDAVGLACLLAVALGTRDAEAVVALQWTALFVRVCGLGRGRAVWSAVVWWAAFGAAEQLTQGVVDVAALVAVVLPGAVVSGLLVSLLSEAFARVDRLRRYGDVLAAASPALVTADDARAVTEAAGDVLRALTADLDGARVSVWTLADGDLRRMAAHPDEHVRRSIALADIPADLRPDPSRGLLQRLPGETAQRVAPTFGSPGDTAEVAVRLLVGRDRRSATGVLVMASPRSLDAERVQALDRLGTEAGLALERVALADDLARSEALFRGVVQSSSDVIALLDADASLRYASPALERIAGIDPALVTGRSFRDFIHPDDVEPALRAFADLEVDGEPATGVQVRMPDATGTWRHVEVTVDAQGEAGALTGFVVVMRDVSARQELEAQLAHQAFHDPLTGLANRPLFAERVERALLRTDRSGRRVGAVLLDLDDFKSVNDALGHAAGDALLIEVAERLRALVRSTDTPARLGGDEFAVVLDDVADDDEAETVARRLLEAFARPFRIADRDVVVRTSAGLATGDAAVDLDTLLRNADVAMYAAKDAGKDGFQRFEAAMHDEALARLELRVALEGALARDELEVVYQPIVDIASGRAAGMEALLRWNHPERGQLAPDVFIPIAEETGLIVPIGRWVLAEACREVHRWRSADPDAADLSVNVNLSARQFRDPSLVESVVAILDAEGLPPSALRLEVTETALVDDVDAAGEVLAALHELGVRVAIDDFGTGYSSFAYLRRFLVDEIKIDREFVRLAAAGPEDAALLRAILKVGHTLDLRTVAEGVEDAADLAALHAWGCDQAQGFLLARPMDASRAIAWLEARRTAEATSVGA